MCKDIIINFIRNGKVVPKDVYALIETDEPALREQIDSRSTVHREKKDVPEQEKVDTEEIGVQCEPIPHLLKTKEADPYVAFDLITDQRSSIERESPSRAQHFIRTENPS